MSAGNREREPRAYGIRSLDLFTRQMGVSPATMWRYRRRGWIETVNLNGRQFVTEDAIRRFVEKAEAGHFAKPPAISKRNDRARERRAA